ncbi:hypothetical protein CK203_058372 [Vitis vinifera]|uniref:EXS domain-containing protein n=1 Tax=Vitis vinifera TaxID=29760 RepID=A0A438G8C3_VITVI|nr:hypothetical protein CK203_058372 [Vitis vinifera]
MHSGPLVHCHSPGSDIPFRYFLSVISLLLVEDSLADSSAFTDYPVLVVVDVVSTLTFDSPWRVHRAWPWKVFSDLERSVCRMLHRQVAPSQVTGLFYYVVNELKGRFSLYVATIAWFEADSVCGSHSVAIPLVLVLPYLFRFKIFDRSIPVIFLSALKYHVFPDRWTNIYRPLWLLSSVLNSLYSFYWDVTRDWDLSFSASPTHSTLKLNLLLFYHLCLNLSSLLNSAFTRIFKFSKASLLSNLLYGRRWVSNVYFWVIGSNLVLRCTWTYKLSAHLRHNYLTVFTITALEIFRRFQWVFFRVENEWNKMNSKSNIQLSMSDTSEEDKLLGSNERNV